jgi:DNA primase catalytic core
MSKRFTDIKEVSAFVKDHVDIYKLITEDTGQKPDRPTDGNNFIFCPFHEEKNKPSFNIRVSTNTYRCFGGCQEGGDAIKWVMSYSGMSYNEGIEHLAERFSLDLSPFIRPASQEEQVRDRYQHIFNTVAEWAHTQFINHPSLYKWYKDDTGFSDEQIAPYKVGYVAATDQLVSFIYQKIPSISQEEIRKLELHDNFLWNDALVYPVYDAAGGVARFYTKLLHPPPDAPFKYRGTSNNHPLFRKDLLYGLYQIRRDLRKNGFKVLLVEGQKAAIASSAVAVQGTGVTDEQISLLRAHGIRQVTACFDGDQAGYLASVKVVDESHRFRGILLKVARMPMDTQCDSLVKMRGPQALQAVVANATLPIEFIVQTRYDVDGKLTLEAKYQLLADVAPIVAKMNEAEIDITSIFLAEKLETEKDAIRSYIREIKTASSKLISIKSEECILHYILLDPLNWAKVRAANLTTEFFTLADHQKVLQAITKAYKDHESGITSKLVADKVALLFPREAERVAKRIDTLVALDPDYTMDVALSTVQDLWQRRVTITQTDDLKARMMDLQQTPQEAVHAFRRSAVSIVDVRRKQSNTPEGVAARVDAVIEQRAAQDTRIIGFDFGSVLPILNATLSGLQKNHQVLISANSGVGKSLLALNILRPIVLQQRVPWLWIASEMEEVELSMRMISLESGLNNTYLQQGRFDNQDQYMAYVRARDLYARGSLYIHKPVSGTIDEVIAIAEEYYFKYGIQGVTWDYVQLVSASRDQRGMSREEVIGQASKAMTNRVASETGLGVCSMCISQLNRSNYKKGEVREGENIGGSYQLQQDATDSIIISEKSAEQIAEQGIQKGNRIISVDKRRGGASDVHIHSMLDDRNSTTLRFEERVNSQEMAGYAHIFGGMK